MEDEKRGGKRREKREWGQEDGVTVVEGQRRGVEEEELRGWRGGKRRKEMRGEKRRGRGREKEGEERGDTESGKTTMAYCGDGKWAEERGEGGRRRGQGEVEKWSVGGGEKGEEEGQRRGEGDEEGREDEESEERREGRGRREGGVRKRREAQGLKEKRRGE